MKVTDRIDYTALAERIRTAKLNRAQRETGVAKAPAPPGALPLSVALDALFVAPLSTRIAKLAPRLAALPTVGFGQVKTDGLSPLEREVARAFELLPLDSDHERARQGLSDALGRCATDDGHLTAEAMEKAYGDEGVALFAELRNVIGPDASRFEQQSAFKYHGLHPLTVERAARSSNRSRSLADMPVLAQLVDEYGSPDALKGIQMVAVQHLLPSNPPLFEAFAKCGLDLNQLHFVGKTYSTDPDVFVEYDRRGYRINPASQKEVENADGDPSVTLARASEEELARLFKNADPSATGIRYLLLDEGGLLVKALHEKFPQFAHQCTTVEQTQHGDQLLDEMQQNGVPLSVPSIDVAQADLKKRVEAVFVGENVRASTAEAIAALDLELPHSMLVAGYGAIGRQVSSAFERRNGLEVMATDPSEKALQRAADDGREAGPQEALLAKAGLYISAAGSTTLRLDQYDGLPDGAIAVNAASGNHPLGMDAFSSEYRDPLEKDDPVVGRTTTFQGRRIRLDQGLQQHQVVQTPAGKRVLVLAEGGVINLAKGFPSDYAQLIEGLLFCGVMQALNSTTPGRTALDAAPQQRIETLMEAFLAERGKSLMEPDFSAASQT